MDESKKTNMEKDPPHGHRDRDSSHEQPSKGETKSPVSKHDPDSARLEAEETFLPDRDGTG